MSKSDHNPPMVKCAPGAIRIGWVNGSSPVTSRYMSNRFP